MVRTITEGYAEDNYPPPRYQSHGRFEVRADEAATDLLLGTRAYWDGLWDNGANAGENAPGDPNNPVQYRADLILDDDPTSVSSFPFQKPEQP